MRRKRKPIKKVDDTKEYLDCMPNPFERLKKANFDVNFYKKLD